MSAPEKEFVLPSGKFARIKPRLTGADYANFFVGMFTQNANIARLMFTIAVAIDGEPVTDEVFDDLDWADCVEIMRLLEPALKTAQPK